MILVILLASKVKVHRLKSLAVYELIQRVEVLSSSPRKTLSFEYQV